MGPTWRVSCHLQPHIKKAPNSTAFIFKSLLVWDVVLGQWSCEFQRRILWTRCWSTLSFLPGLDVEHSSSFVTQFGHPCWNSKKPTLGDTFWVSRSSWAELAHPPRPWSCFHFGVIGLRGKQGWSLWQGHQSHLKGKALALVNLFLHPRHGCFNTPIEELMIIATIYWALSICQTQTSTSWKSCNWILLTSPLLTMREPIQED